MINSGAFGIGRYIGPKSLNWRKTFTFIYGKIKKIGCSAGNVKCEGDVWMV